MMSGSNCPRKTQKHPPEAMPSRGGAYRTIIGPDRMAWFPCREMIGNAPGASARGLEVMKTCAGLKVDLVPVAAKPVRKFVLEIVSHVNEVIVEPSNSQGNLPSDRKVAAHKAIDPTRFSGCKIEVLVLRQVHVFLPWLDNPACDHCCVRLFVCCPVSSDQLTLQNNVIVKK